MAPSTLPPRTTASTGSAPPGAVQPAVFAGSGAPGLTDRFGAVAVFNGLFWFVWFRAADPTAKDLKQNKHSKQNKDSVIAAKDVELVAKAAELAAKDDAGRKIASQNQTKTSLQSLVCFGDGMGWR
jgi:hypothetical protein